MALPLVPASLPLVPTSTPPAALALPLPLALPPVRYLSPLRGLTAACAKGQWRQALPQQAPRRRWERAVKTL